MIETAELAARITGARRRIEAACHRAGRDRSAVRLVAVTKTQPLAVVRTAIAAGLSDFGENRVQEAAVKIRELSTEFPGLTWRLIGQLQSNKAKAAVELFQEIQAVDREVLVERVAREAEKAGRIVPILLEVNLGGEASKAGVSPGDLKNLLSAARRSPSLDVRGLMTVPPFFSNPEEARPFFRRLRELAASASESIGAALPELSMGMSHDFEIAVEEGATQVRLGTLLFGPRPA